MGPAVGHLGFAWALGAGLALMAWELFAPTTVFLWTGIAALATAVPMALDPGLPWGAALAIWAVLSPLCVVAARRYHRGHPLGGERVRPAGAPNAYGSEFVGMETVLAADSRQREARVNLNGAAWGVKLDRDLKAGTRVRVTGVEGILLKAEPVESPRA